MFLLYSRRQKRALYNNSSTHRSNRLRMSDIPYLPRDIKVLIMIIRWRLMRADCFERKLKPFCKESRQMYRCPVTDKWISKPILIKLYPPDGTRDDRKYKKMVKIWHARTTYLENFWLQWRKRTKRTQQDENSEDDEIDLSFF